MYGPQSVVQGVRILTAPSLASKIALDSKRVATARSTRWKEFVTARSIPGRQKVLYQACTTWFHGRATPRNKTPGSPLRLCSTFASLSAPSIRSIRRSQQRPHPRLTPPRQWPSQRPSFQQRPPPNESVADQPRPQALISTLKRAEVLIFTSFLTLPFSILPVFRFFLLKLLPGQEVFSTNAFITSADWLFSNVPLGARELSQVFRFSSTSSARVWRFFIDRLFRFSSTIPR